ncbi:putative pentatricopeptide repeat-containing protein At5g40405 [Tasmannia lanceolata]|uniref:putative pentatricopeptide repeat-containing protein At5g40405 n=1 Tax=Tasmannia lanceolata TaxID=3420 RepID=UPI0040648CA1
MSSSLRCIANHPTITLVESYHTLKEIKQIHTQVLVNGLLNHPLFLGKFIASIALSHPHNITYSTQILNQSQNPNLFTLNTMIRAYSKTPTPHLGFQFYNQILRSNLSPDNYTFTFLIRTCAHLSSLDSGPAVHGTTLKRGFDSDPHVQSGLIHLYSELGSFHSSRSLFLEIRCPDLVTQTAMVSACAGSGHIEFARKLFDEMPHRDPIAWNAMIAGYSQCGQSREALNLFNLMQFEGTKVNEVTMVSVVSACAHLGALDQGRWVHVYIEKNKLPLTVTLGTALIDMYSKCGNMTRAMEVFLRMREKNVYTWSSLMGGLAMNGAGERCLDLFSLMKQEGILPNEVTFVSVLRGCSVAGLVEKGREHFNSMTRVYNLKPWPEHYGCMVDLYGRAGRLDDAINFINDMPIKPHVGAWGALLNACRIHKNIELGEFALGKIVELEVTNDGAYVLLSNIYADSRNWDGVSNVRKLMKVGGVRKEPGCSVIEVGGEVHEFFVGDKSHPRYGEIELKLGEISRKLRLAGYVANTNQVLFDIEEEEKEDALCRHSEKLAIAFGFISLGEGVPIRIVKNLRICRDCHDGTKMVSKVFNREIIVRDRNRFHHFKDGECSCMDFW